MRLQRLTGLEREKIEQEYQDLMKLIAELKAILADEEKVLEIIREELTEVKSASMIRDAQKLQLVVWSLLKMKT